MHILIRRAWLLLLFVLFVYSSVIAADSDESLYGGTLVRPTTSDPKSFNPIIAKETSTTAITNLIFEGLTRVNPFTLEIEPHLALRWEMDETGKIWTFYLREDVQWSDGIPFNAHDVVFTFNRLIFNPDIFASSRDIFMINGQKLGVFAISDHTVRFELPQPFAPFLMMMAGQEIVPRHKLDTTVEEGNFNAAWGLDSRPEDIVGTGPFVLEKYESSERIVLKKNKRYWRKGKANERLPYLDRIILVILQNLDVMILRFQEGSLDYVSLRGSDFPILKPQEKEKDFTIYRMGPAFGETFLTFNQNLKKKEDETAFILPWMQKLFRDERFRQAVSYAMDRQSMIDILMNGLGSAQFSPMSPAAITFYHDDVRKYNYDPEKAKAMLAQIGLKDRDQDGVLEDAQANDIAFNILTNADNTQRVQTAQMIRKDLENIGIRVQVVPMEFNALVTKLNASFDWEAMILGLTGGVEPHFARNVWHSSGQLHLWFPMQEEPSTDWEKRINTIFDRGVSEMDLEKRKALYNEWQEIAAEYLPLVYTVQAESIFAVRNRFGNLKPSVNGGAFHNIEELYILERSADSE